MTSHRVGKSKGPFRHRTVLCKFISCALICTLIFFGWTVSSLHKRFARIGSVRHERPAADSSHPPTFIDTNLFDGDDAEPQSCSSHNNASLCWTIESGIQYSGTTKSMKQSIRDALVFNMMSIGTGIWSRHQAEHIVDQNMKSVLSSAVSNPRISAVVFDRLSNIARFQGQCPIQVQVITRPDTVVSMHWMRAKQKNNCAVAPRPLPISIATGAGIIWRRWPSFVFDDELRMMRVVSRLKSITTQLKWKTNQSVRVCLDTLLKNDENLKRTIQRGFRSAFSLKFVHDDSKDSRSCQRSFSPQSSLTLSSAPCEVVVQKNVNGGVMAIVSSAPVGVFASSPRRLVTTQNSLRLLEEEEKNSTLRLQLWLHERHVSAQSYCRLIENLVRAAAESVEAGKSLSSSTCQYNLMPTNRTDQSAVDGGEHLIVAHLVCDNVSANSTSGSGSFWIHQCRNYSSLASPLRTTTFVHVVTGEDDELVATLTITWNRNKTSAWGIPSSDVSCSLSVATDALIVSFDYTLLPCICNSITEAACVSSNRPQVIYIIPGPSVTQAERGRVERAIVECYRLRGCIAPIVAWFRPGNDEEEHPSSIQNYHSSPTVLARIESEGVTSLQLEEQYFLSTAHDPTDPSSRVSTVAVKDIEELALQVILMVRSVSGTAEAPTTAGNMSSLSTNSDEKMSSSSDNTDRRFVRWAHRTLYDPDFMWFPNLSMPWKIISTVDVMRDLRCNSTDDEGSTQNPAMCLPFECHESSLGAESWSRLKDILCDLKPPLSSNEMSSHRRWSLMVPETFAADSTLVYAQRLLSSEYSTLLPPVENGRSLSKVEKKQRKLLKVLGPNVENETRLAWHTENTDHLSDMLVLPVIDSQLIQRQDVERWITFVHYPWVLDNMYHLHNDNIFPLLLAIAHVNSRLLNDISNGSSQSSSPVTCLRLVLLPTHRTNRPLSFALDLLRMIFDEVVVLPHNQSQNISAHRGLKNNVCTLPFDSKNSDRHLAGEGNIIVGRPRRPFSSKMRDVAPYVTNRIIRVWQRLTRQYVRIKSKPPGGDQLAAFKGSDVVRWFGNVDMTLDHSNSMIGVGDKTEIVVTWIVRLGERSMETDGTLLAWVVRRSEQVLCSQFHCCACVIRLQVCCEGLEYFEQVRLIQRTDVLLGTHGAGLLHIINLTPRLKRVTLLQQQQQHPRRDHRLEDPDSSLSHCLLLTPLVVHIGSIRLNYHEQTVIERLAILASTSTKKRIRFVSTFSSPTLRDIGAHWRSSFYLDSSAIFDLWEHALWMYFHAE